MSQKLGQVWRRAAMGLLYAAVGGVAWGSEYYKVSVLQSSPSHLSGEWTPFGWGGSINDTGMAAWHAYRWVNGSFEHGVFRGNGSFVEQIATRPGQVDQVSINNSGQISYRQSDPENGLRRYLWNNGVTTVMYSCGTNAAPRINCDATGLGDNGNTASSYSIPGIADRYGILSSGGQMLADTAGNPYPGGGGVTPSISRDGTVAAFVVERQTDSAHGVLRLNLGSGATFAPTGWPQLSATGSTVDNNGNVGLVRSGSTNPGNASTLPGLVAVLGNDGAIRKVASTADGRFEQIGYGFNASLAQNNLGQVAFAAVDFLGNTRSHGIYVGDWSERHAALRVADEGDVVSEDGKRFVGATQFSLAPHGMNDKGQVVFEGLVQSGTQNYWAILKADPPPGVTPGNPIVPGPGDALPGGGWRNAIREPIINLNGPVYIDPEIAIGYDYTVDGGPNVASVYIPAPLPNGDADFTLVFGGQSFALKAGVPFDFTAVVAEGVARFRIAGIDTTEALDPEDPTAFVTGLTFVRIAEREFAVNMVPVKAVPEPGTWALAAVGLLALGLRRRVMLSPETGVNHV